MLIPALRTVGNIVTGDDMQTQVGPTVKILLNILFFLLIFFRVSNAHLDHQYLEL